MQWLLPVRTTAAPDAAKTCFPSGKAVKAFFSDRKGSVPASLTGHEGTQADCL